MKRITRLTTATALALSLGSGLAIAQDTESHLAHHGATGTPAGQAGTMMPGTMAPGAAPATPFGMPGGIGPGGAAAVPSMMQMMQMMRLMGGMMTRGAAMSAMGMTRFDHIAGRIAFLKAELGITPEQEPKWTAFAGALQAAATKIEPMQARMLAAGVSGITPLPDRLQAEATLLDARAAAMHEIVSTADALYAVLTPAQRAKADAVMAGPQGMM
ncbi:MAG: Spy/CpxP family protein refolding chaperone [Rhodospirillales bacterium]|nr:Spy/CpxP family protein refolding chaperone [Rhodospirillales bacterium]